MNKKNTIAIAALAMLGIAYAIWAVGAPSNNAPTANSLDNLVANGDIFLGKITNKNVEPGKLSGVGEYDRNCVSVAGGLTNCHGGIKTSKFGVIDFNYEHDMAKKPCIALGEKVVVEILDSDGNARVQRVF